MDDHLKDMLARLKSVRGENWAERSNALYRHIAELPDECRVLAIGEHRVTDWHTPGALIYDAHLTAERVVVHFVDFNGSIATWGQAQNFHSNTPHKSIAREVFIHGDDDRTVIRSAG